VVPTRLSNWHIGKGRKSGRKSEKKFSDHFERKKQTINLSLLSIPYHKGVLIAGLLPFPFPFDIDFDFEFDFDFDFKFEFEFDFDFKLDFSIHFFFFLFLSNLAFTFSSSLLHPRSFLEHHVPSISSRHPHHAFCELLL